MVRRTWLSLIFVWVAVLLPLTGQGQGSLPIRAYGVEQGLAIPSVNALAQDFQGLVWAGTESGLFRFDGRSWHGVDVKLPSQYVNALLVDRKGHLWVATRAGLAVFSPLRPDTVWTPGGAPTTIISQIGEDAAGRIWVLGPEGPCSQGPDGVFALDPEWPAGVRTQALFADPDSSEILASNGRAVLAKAQPKEPWSIDVVPLSGPAEIIIAVARDGGGTRWARSDRAVYRRLPDREAWERVSASLFGPSPDTARLTRDREGWVWINTGTDMVRARGTTLEPLGGGSGLGASVTGMVDRDGCWWFGWTGVRQVLGGGLWRHFHEKEGLPSPVVWNLLRDASGRLWIATDAGIAVTEQGRWQLVHRGQISRLTKAPDGSLFAVGSPGGTVYRIEPGTLKVERLRVDALDPSAVMRGLAVLPDGGLLVSDFLDGVAHGRREGARWRWTRTLVEGTPAKGVLLLNQDAGGQTFLAMGKALFHWVDGNWRRVPDTLGHLPFLGTVRRDGSLVVSYFDKPVFTVHRWQGGTWHRTSVLEPFGQEKNLVVYSALEGKAGDFWLGTSQGLVRLGAALDRALDWFGPGEGAPGADSTAGGLFQEGNSDLWYGTTEGLGQFKAGALLAESPLPAPVLLSPLPGAGPDPGLRLPPRGTLSVRFGLPAFRDSGRVRLQTRIPGVDRGWVDQETLAIQYGRLPAGRFKLEVRATLPGGRMGPVFMLPFRVDPVWWETWWAMALGFFGLAGLAAGFHSLRARNLRARNLLLESQVAERVSELRSLMRKLEEEKLRADSASKAKSEFLAAMSHELRTPLNAILLYADLVRDEAEGKGEQTIVRDMDKITSSSRHLVSMVNDVLDLSKIEEGKLALHPETISVPELLSEVEATLRPLAEHRANRLEVACPPHLPGLVADRTRLMQVLLNLGSNACKFTEGGSVRLEVAVEEDRMAFRVTDTGIGMSPKEVGRVFEAYMQASSGTHKRFGGTGLGLSISQKFVELMGGILTVTSKPDHGSCFSFQLSLGHADPSG
jgi:signal transduction histidine kinase/ligand-binding sensor domain-containing protein